MLIDISQEVFSCAVYPGDPAPEKTVLASMEAGDACSVTAFSMCAHNGTHADAPAHFIRDGKTIGELGLAPFVGPCWVTWHEGDVTAADAQRILSEAAAGGAAERILIAGNAVVTETAAEVFAAAGLLLLGNDSQTVGPPEAPMKAHLSLLGAGTVLLEGAVLKNVPPGRYFLCAAPLNLGDTEGAPCRAFLMTEDRNTSCN